METKKVYIIPENDIQRQFEILSNKLTDILTLLESKENSKKQDKGFLTRKEVAKLLKISLPTLTSYVKLKYLPVKRIGSRVLFDKNDVLEAIQNINFRKY